MALPKLLNFTALSFSFFLFQLKNMTINGNTLTGLLWNFNEIKHTDCLAQSLWIGSKHATLNVPLSHIIVTILRWRWLGNSKCRQSFWPLPWATANADNILTSPLSNSKCRQYSDLSLAARRFPLWKMYSVPGRGKHHQRRVADAKMNLHKLTKMTLIPR